MNITSRIECFVKTMLSLVRVAISPRSTKIIDFKIGDSDECYILGNGPSLSTDVDKYSDRMMNGAKVCVNYFAMSDLYQAVKPEYYVLLDPAFLKKDVSAEFDDNRRELFAKITENTFWDMVMFLPMNCQIGGVVEEISNNNGKINIVYFNTNTFDGFDLLAFTFMKLNMAIPVAQNVLVAALFLALNLGYKKNYLLGADHSWHEEIAVDNKNTVCLKDRHFSDVSEPILKPWYKDLSQTETWKMSEILSAFSRMFAGYETIEKYSREKDAKIFNLSSKTYIDAFERR